MEIINKAFKNFSSRADVRCASKHVETPTLEGLIFLNIPSYGGGVDIWGNREDYMSDSSEPKTPEKKSFDLQDKQDGLLELCGIYSSLHLGECQIGLSQALKLAQGRNFDIDIKGKETIIFQVDGEPYVTKGPARIEIIRKDQVRLLVRATERHHYVAKKAIDVIAWAREQGIIDKTQGDIILNEFSKRSKS